MAKQRKLAGGRPKVVINSEQVEQLAAINCSVEEIAAVMGCHKRTLERRFAAVIKNGRDKGRMSLKRAQYTLALKGNATMQIWLGKQLLGQRDQRDQPPGDPQDSARQIREMVGALFAVQEPAGKVT